VSKTIVPNNSVDKATDKVLSTPTIKSTTSITVNESVTAITIAEDWFYWLQHHTRLLLVGVVMLSLLFFSLIIGLRAGFFERWSSPNSITIQQKTTLFVTVTPTLDPTNYPELGTGQGAIIGTPTPFTQTMSKIDQPYFAEANEMGKIMVFMYHRIMYPEARYQRTPDNFRADLQQLYQRGYYPINFIDLINGLQNVPPGKKPVVLTFDDSDITQFQVFADNTVDANSAVGVLLDFHALYGDDWPLKATFFILGDDRNNYYRIFGQPDYAKAKLKFLQDMGFEVASHTVTHADLSVSTSERIYWELAVSHHVLEEMLPDYEIHSLAVPFGGFPYTLEFLHSGRWGDYRYDYIGNAAAWGGASPSPFSDDFERYKIPRIEVTAKDFDYWITYFDEHPDEYYIADGDPNRLTYPEPALTKAP